MSESFGIRVGFSQGIAIFEASRWTAGWQDKGGRQEPDGIPRVQRDAQANMKTLAMTDNLRSILTRLESLTAQDQARWAG